MKYVKMLFFLGLIAYSIALLSVEFRHGQEHVRGFFSDIVINADFPLTYRSSFGINTTLSVFFLGSTALLYFVCLGAGAKDIKTSLFLWFQVGIFLYLAGDERLQFHEWLGVHLGIEDALVLMAVGGLEVLVLFILGNVRNQSWKTNAPLLACCVFFGTMVVLDALAPEEMKGRLAMEDLTKLWAVVFLFSYAWNYCIASVGKPVEVES